MPSSRLSSWPAESGQSSRPPGREGLESSLLGMHKPVYTPNCAQGVYKPVHSLWFKNSTFTQLHKKHRPSAEKYTFCTQTSYAKSYTKHMLYTLKNITSHLLCHRLSTLYTMVTMTTTNLYIPNRRNGQ